MKTILFLAMIALLPNLCFANSSNLSNSIELNFSKDPIPLTTFVELVYGKILGKNYRFDDSFLHIDKQMKLYIKDINPESIPTYLKAFEKDYGYKSTLDSKGVYVFSASQTTPSAANELPITDFSLTPTSVQSPTKSIDSDSLFDPVKPDTKTIFYDCKDDCLKLIEALKIFPDLKTASIRKKLAIVAPVQIENEIKDFLEVLDSSPRNYQIHAYLYEFGSSETHSSAFQVLASIFSSQLGLKLNDGMAKQSNAISLTLPNFSAIFTALDNDSRFSLLSSPSGSVLDGKPFKMSIGQEVPTLNQIVNNTNGSQSQSVVYRDSGVILNVTPTYLTDHSATIDISQQVSSFVGSVAGTASAPTLNKREVSTSLVLDHGKTLVFAGLREFKSDNSNSGFFGINVGKNKSYTDLPPTTLPI